MVAQRQEVLQPLVMSWLGKVQEATRSKQRFNDAGEQCMAFFNGACGFMWESKFLQKYVGGGMAPRFKITIAKAFELVALFGPTLYWRNPTRLVKPRPRVTIPPELFGGMDPAGMMMVQQALMQAQQQESVDQVVASMLEMYLNYTPTEQPGGGLATHASDAITEALVKGRGCLWVQPYYMPGSQRVLTGCFQDTVDNLLIDPDATSLHNAKWIAQRCIKPVWEAEREFGLPPGTLAGKGNFESGDAQGRNHANDWANVDRRVGKTHDLITYYKIWSKGGVGGRLAGPARLDDDLSRAFDQVIGDYAYIVVAPGVPFPLNAPTEFVRNASDSEILRKFQWPAPFWMDDRWPVTVLDFYRAPNEAWPIAPMAPGLGELTFLNILISQMANHIWMSSRSFYTGPKSLEKELRAAIEGGADLSFLQHNGVSGQKLSDIIGFLQHPQMNPDVWKIVDAVMMMFDRRTGLSDLLYGLNPGGVQSRTAEDIATKREMVSVRPDYMAGCVEDWMTEAADMEKLVARWFVEPQDLKGLFGPLEQHLWGQHITGMDPEYVVRELRASIAANSTRKPDKARDVENMQQILPVLLPVMQEYLGMTGNPGPLNGLLARWGKTIDQDMQEMMLPPPEPSGNPEAEAAAQIQQLELEQHQQEMQMDRESHQQQMQISGQKARQDALIAAIKMRTMEQTAKTQQQIAKQKAKQKPKPRARAAA